MAMLPSEYIAIGGVIDPDANAAATLTSDYINMEYFHMAMAVVLAGIQGSSGTLDASVIQATSSTGAGAKAITGKSITQLTTGDNDKQAIINVRTDELDVDNGFKFVALKMTVGTSTGDSAGIIFGVQPRFGPANANDLASVAEIVA